MLLLSTNHIGNKIKHSGADGLALQITKPARAAGLVAENSDGDVTYIADVRVYAFEHLLIVFDTDEVAVEHIATVVASATRDTDSIYQAMDATVQIAGNGYQVQLPPAVDAGFQRGDHAPCHTARGMIVISKDDGTTAGADAGRLARDLVTIRNGQLSK